MNYRFLVIWIILIFPSYSHAQQNKCNCEENFKWLKDTFEKNDAGFEYGLQQKSKEAYEKHNTNILQKTRKATTKDECAQVMQDWLLFFRKAHFSITPINNGAETNNKGESSWHSISVTEEQIKNTSLNTTDPFEGIWQTGAYTIGIVRENNKYSGVILKSSNPAWKPNYVKFTIDKSGSGVYYMGDFSPYKFEKSDFIGKNTLRLGSFYLARVYPELKDEESIAFYAKEIRADNPFIHKLSDKTLLLRIPSFNGQQKSLIDTLLGSNDKLIKATENLIIDIRNNGGGDDVSYEKIIPYLYTNPIRIINMELLSTPLNNKRMERYLSLPDLSEKSRKEVNEVLAVLNANLGKFVNLGGDKTVEIQTLDAVLPNPKNIAIIINQINGSTAEQFLLAAKQSKKVKLYGVTTMGVLDISNMNFVNSPSNEFNLGYCISKSNRIPDMAIDGKGIMPDYYIDKTIPDPQWLDFVQKIIEQ
ncbi:S41 family peptidase [Flavihumibacter solisilvae]|uniref:Tail specific protease domain-containing protein n=1 Tax=Flavihumibacter solisilvae TaxID=1349421 RepID=A0A0C1IVN6_9BACT|nr:S41 family peptidase [Flavihumibacter solisilvae]KIC94514.1 hypothetical protein OI18_10350 [Flavihumibacter solisilvae]